MISGSKAAPKSTFSTRTCAHKAHFMSPGECRWWLPQCLTALEYLDPSQVPRFSVAGYRPWAREAQLTKAPLVSR